MSEETTRGAWFDRVCVATLLGDRINYTGEHLTECWTDEDMDDDDT